MLEGIIGFVLEVVLEAISLGIDSHGTKEDKITSYILLMALGLGVSAFLISSGISDASAVKTAIGVVLMLLCIAVTVYQIRKHWKEK